MSDPQYWLQRWHDNNIKFNQDAVNPFLQAYIHHFSLPLGGKIFVPLCGKSIDMLWFLQKGYQVIGIELSDIACEAFFKENNLTYSEDNLGGFVRYSNDQITLLAGDIFNLSKDLIGEIDLIYDRAALIALPEADRINYTKKLIELSSQQTQTLLITIVYDQSEMPGPPYSVSDTMVKSYFNTGYDIQILTQHPAESIPQHLIDKGLKKAENLVLKLVP